MEFCRSYRKGESAYYAEREKGTIEVYEDNLKHLYRETSFYGALDFKAYVKDMFSNCGKKQIRIAGRFPTYRIETSC